MIYFASRLNAGVLTAHPVFYFANSLSLCQKLILAGYRINGAVRAATNDRARVHLIDDGIRLDLRDIISEDLKRHCRYLQTSIDASLSRSPR